jgi:hypothetical protein
MGRRRRSPSQAQLRSLLRQLAADAARCPALGAPGSARMLALLLAHARACGAAETLQGLAERAAHAEGPAVEHAGGGSAAAAAAAEQEDAAMEIADRDEPAVAVTLDLCCEGGHGFVAPEDAAVEALFACSLAPVGPRLAVCQLSVEEELRSGACSAEV